MSNKTLSKGFKMAIVASFLLILPVMAVLFSKFGLDRYRAMRSEMSLYKDSIAMPTIDLHAHRNFHINQDYTKGRMLLVHFASSIKGGGAEKLLARLQPIQTIFNKEDKRKYAILSYTLDSAASINHHLEKSLLDTFNWKFLTIDSAQFFALRQQFKVAADSAETSVVLVDSKGKICDLYDVSKEPSVERMEIHMSLVIPKKQRKRIEYKADKDPYAE